MRVAAVTMLCALFMSCAKTDSWDLFVVNRTSDLVKPEIVVSNISMTTRPMPPGDKTWGTGLKHIPEDLVLRWKRGEKTFSQKVEISVPETIDRSEFFAVNLIITNENLVKVEIGEGLDESYYGIADSIAHLCVTWHEHALLKKVLGLDRCLADHRNARGETSLHYAYMTDDCDAIRILKDFGAKPLEDENGRLPETCGLVRQFVSSAKAGNRNAAKSLLADRPELVDCEHCDPPFGTGSSALWCAASNGDAEMVSMLLDYGATPDNFSSEMRSTPLLTTECSSVAALLLDAGADPNTRDRVEYRNASPLHNAVLNEDIDLVGLLLRAGADPNITDFQGRSPLHWVAANFAHPPKEIVEMLIAHGASLAITDEEDISPSDLASDEVRVYFTSIDKG